MWDDFDGYEVEDDRFADDAAEWETEQVFQDNEGEGSENEDSEDEWDGGEADWCDHGDHEESEDGWLDGSYEE